MSLSEYKHYLPSPHFVRITSALGIAVVLVFAVSFLSNYRSARSIKNANITAALTSPESLALDSDSDGLKDWEEALWGTLPHNIDTDGDGTSDGEEVKNGRNPLVSGPDDSLEATGSSFGFGKNASSSPISKTDAFAREVYASIAAQKAESGSIDPAYVAEVSTSFAQFIAGREKIVYIKKDVRTIENSSEATLRAYGNAVGSIVLKAESNIGEGEMAIIVRALQQNSESELEKLASISDVYTNLVQELLLIPIPKITLYAHLALVNNIADIARSVADMQQLMSDPLAGMAAFGTYRTNMEKLTSSLTTLRSVFVTKSIVFTSKEPGRIFNK